MKDHCVVIFFFHLRKFSYSFFASKKKKSIFFQRSKLNVIWKLYTLRTFFVWFNLKQNDRVEANFVNIAPIFTGFSARHQWVMLYQNREILLAFQRESLSFQYFYSHLVLSTLPDQLEKWSIFPSNSNILHLQPP